MHFALIVRMEVAEPVEGLDDFKDALDTLMEPYCEEPSERFLVFENDEAELQEEYLTGSEKMVRLEDGSYQHPWLAPAALREAAVEVPFVTAYKTFDEFCEGWHDRTRDEWYQRYGRWVNPNGRWDWFEVGGRWKGFFTDRNGVECDWVRYADLDLDALMAKAREDAANFHDELTYYLAQEMPSVQHDKIALPKGHGKRMRLRSRALDVGLMYMSKTQERYDRSAVRVTPGWGYSRDEWDVWLYHEDKQCFVAQFASFFHPLLPYALLAPPRGWLSAHGEFNLSLSSEERANYLRAHKQHMLDVLLTNQKPEHLLVLVDYHS